MQKTIILFPVVRTLALSLVLLVSACAPTQTTRSAGQTIDDATVTAKVKTEIAQAEGLGSALEVNVDTYRGVVILAGFVDNEEQKRAAELAAMRVPGVEKVFDNLKLKTAP